MAIRVGTSVAKFSANWNMGFHEHPDIEISTVFQGKGQFWYGSHCIPVFEGSVVLIPPSIPHGYNSTTGIQFGIIHAAGLPKDLMNEFHSLLQDDQPEVLHLSHSDVQLYESMFRDWLRSVSRGNDDQNLSTVKAWIRLLLAFVRDRSRLSEFPLTLESAADYIQTNVHRELQMCDVASQFGMGVSTFRRLFRASYGMSPKQYYQGCRLEEAKWLLRTTDMPVKEVAAAVGFDSLHGFSAWFNHMTDLSPSRWRRAQQIDRISEDVGYINQ